MNIRRYCQTSRAIYDILLSQHNIVCFVSDTIDTHLDTKDIFPDINIRFYVGFPSDIVYSQGHKWLTAGIFFFASFQRWQ